MMNMQIGDFAEMEKKYSKFFICCKVKENISENQ